MKAALGMAIAGLPFRYTEATSLKRFGSMRFAVPLSKMLARLHLWYPAAVVLVQEPLLSLDRHSVGRLSYALLMSHRMRGGSADALFHRILLGNETRSAEVSIALSEMATRIAQPALAEDLLAQAVESAADAFTKGAAECLLRTTVAIRDGSLEVAVRHAVDALELHAGERVVLAPLSGAYREMFALWLQQVRAHVTTRVVVLAMDDAAMAAVQHESDVVLVDARSHFAWTCEGKLQPQTRGVLWFLRTLYLRELVRRGHTTLVLDTDAMPVGDVWSMIANQGPCDVVAQLDHSIPMDVDRQLGFVVCCGFMVWNSTAAANALLDRFAAAAQVERDDQLALNHLIAAEGVVGKEESPRGLRFGSAGVHFACPDVSLVSRSLNSGTVVRHFHQQGQTIAELQRALAS